MVILFPQKQKKLVAVSQEKHLALERSRLLLKATAVINKDDVISKFLGCPGIPRAKETGSQSLLSQWTLTCLTVPSESAQSPGPDGFLQKDQGPLLHHLQSWWPAQGFMNCCLWALMRKKVGILCVESTLRNLCETHIQTESSLSQDARSFLQFQQSWEDPFFRIFLSIIMILQNTRGAWYL